MATTVKLINELYEETILDITSSTNKWQYFLKCASMNYKYNFQEQLLIYAQRPNAIACAEIDTWNNTFKRYVNNGCAGIGLLTESNGKPRIRYVWDINDTHSIFGRKGKDIKLWKVSKIYEEQVIESLENKYGELENKDNFVEAIKSVAVNLTEDNSSDYINDFVSNIDNTNLNEIPVEDAIKEYKELLKNSVAYMILNRSGINPDQYFNELDFADIKLFNNIDGLAQLGIAISDISEMGIQEIYTSLKNIRISEIEKIRTFDKNKNINYDGSEKENFRERDDFNEHNLQRNERTIDTELDSNKQGGSTTREIRNDEITILERTQEGNLSNNDNERHISGTFEGNRGSSTTEIGNNNNENEEGLGNNREFETTRPNEMDGNDEQYQEYSRGNNNERTNIQLDYYERDEKNHPSYVVLEEQINQILSTTPHFKVKNPSIKEFFKEEHTIAEKEDYLMKIFNSDYSGVLVDGKMYGYKNYKNGVLFWKGNFIGREAETFVSWEELTKNFDAMILLNQLDNENAISTESKVEFTDEFISQYFLRKDKDIRFEIYNFFSKDLPTNDYVNYIKNRYGIGGASYTIDGSGVGINYDSKGIQFYRGFYDDKSYQTELLSWNKVAKKIRELINSDRYITKEEKDDYNEWLKFYKDDSHLYLSRKDIDEDEEIEIDNSEYEYQYKVGDKVFIGTDEYIIDNIGIFNVVLYNPQMPLFNREMSIVDFEEKMKENPANEHLRVEKENINSFVDNDELKNEDINNIVEKDNWYGEYNDAVDLINHIFKVYNQADINCYFTDNVEIVAEDSDGNKWIGKDLYDFLFNQLFDYDKNGNVELVDPKDIKRLEEYRKNYQEETKDIIEEENTKIIDNPQVIKESPKVKIEKENNYILHPEIPYEDRINYKIDNDNIGVGTPKERFRNNINAIKVLKQCEEENRYATKEEQEVLAQYVGWGGLSEAFDETKWQDEYKELKELLTEEEYHSAKNTVLSAFYTPPIVIKAMYKALSNMGLEKGNILEPSCGIGNFIGLLPNNDKLKIYGVEIDDLSGRIARQLYQKSSIAIKGFEKVNYSNSFFDVAIGNVPFGTEKVNDKKYDKYSFLIHDYFFAKTIDKVRPGGIIALITSNGTLDKENNEVRKYIAQRADFLGAIRLPNNAFKDSAGTKVTSDIIFLQKRDSIIDIVPTWVNLDTTEDGITMNSYFVEHPEMIMGKMELASSQFGGYKPTCKPLEDEKLEDLLDNAIQNIHAEIKDYQLEELTDEDLSIEADLNVKNFSYTIVDNKIYYRENSRMYPQELSLTAENRVRGLIELRDITRELINMQLEDYSDEEIKKMQERLNTTYDKFIKKYGLINSRGNSSVFSNDNSYFLLCSLEILDENGELLRKADMFNKRTIRPHIEKKNINTSRDALLVSLADKAKVDLNYMYEISHIQVDKIIEDLKGEIFNVPEEGEPNNWVTADEYLSGNVREKLEKAEEFAKDDERFNINVEYLKQALPEDIPTSEINLRLGATWIPTEIIQQFMVETFESSYYAKTMTKVHYSSLSGEWNVENKRIDEGTVAASSTFGTKRASAYRLLEDALNLRDTKIFDYEYDDTGKKKAILNKKETAIAQAKQDKIKEAFNDWVWQDIDRREMLTKRYNRIFNSIKPREYDGSHLDFYGMNPEINLRQHQLNAIARILYGGNTLLAHEVGAGKTYEMVAAAMESKRLGLCNKSLFVVPNHIIEQFASEFLQLYPSANILVSTKKDFETANRKKFCSRIATGDYDAIIIGHSQFEKIPMSDERQIKILNKQLDDITEGIKELQRNRGEKITIKALVKSQKAIEKKLEKLNSKEKKDDVVNFEELGVDRLFVDEAHYYKNLYLYTKMRNVGGIAQNEAQKSSDLYMKCRYLDEITGGKGIIFATGTPVSNTMAELYTMQRYLQYDSLLKMGLQHFDSWASTFGETITAIELSPEGTGYRTKTRFARFYNLPELMSVFKEVADIQTSDTLNLPVPKANYENIVIPPSEIQEELVKSFAERAEKVRNREVDPREDNMLKITNDGRKLSLDQRLINPLLPPNEKSKVQICADNVYRIWTETKDKKLSQLIFCDLSTPKGDGSFNVYDEMKKILIEKGIPENEIEFIHNANTEVKKKELFANVRKGQVRVLMGSTQKMGAGTNCQDKLIALHDMDCPWRPADLTQRSGRIVRQGNQNDEVFIYRYVTEKTFDAYSYQTVEQKQKFISQVITSKTPVRAMEDIDEVALSYAEIKALAAGNPLIIEKTELDTEVSKLKLLKQNYLDEKYRLEEKVKRYLPVEIKDLENMIENQKKDLVILNDNQLEEDKFLIKIDGVEYTDKTLGGEKLIEKCRTTSTDFVDIGEYRGFNISVRFNILYKEMQVFLRNNGQYEVELGESPTGNITRIDNVLDGISKKLELTEKELVETNKQLETAKEQLNKDFPQEQELKDKTKRLNEVNKLLELDKQDKTIMDDSDEVDKDNEVEKDDYER